MPAQAYELKTYFCMQLPHMHSSNNLRNKKSQFIIALKHFTGLLLHICYMTWHSGNLSFFLAFVAIKLNIYAFKISQTSWQYITALLLFLGG